MNQNKDLCYVAYLNRQILPWLQVDSEALLLAPLLLIMSSLLYLHVQKQNKV